VKGLPEACVERVKTCREENGGETCSVMEQVCAGMTRPADPNAPADCPAPPGEPAPSAGGASTQPGEAGRCLLKLKICLEEAGEIASCIEIARQCPELGHTDSTPVPPA
jgi:hypothetical protein